MHEIDLQYMHEMMGLVESDMRRYTIIWMTDPLTYFRSTSCWWRNDVIFQFSDGWILIPVWWSWWLDGSREMRRYTLRF